MAQLTTIMNGLLAGNLDAVGQVLEALTGEARLLKYLQEVQKGTPGKETVEYIRGLKSVITMLENGQAQLAAKASVQFAAYLRNGAVIQKRGYYAMGLMEEIIAAQYAEAPDHKVVNLCSAVTWYCMGGMYGKAFALLDQCERLGFPDSELREWVQKEEGKGRFS